jgi:hypothetical protein
MQRHGRYTVVLPLLPCASKGNTELPSARATLGGLQAGEVGVLGSQFSHKSQQVRQVRAVPRPVPKK